MTVLVVEDELLIRWSLRTCLQRLGLNVLEAESGEAGLAMLGKRSVDGVILDLRLPGVSGLDVLKRVRAEHPECHVWMMTAHGTPEAEAEARSLGVDDFMAKPFDCGVLADKVLATLSG